MTTPEDAKRYVEKEITRRAREYGFPVPEQFEWSPPPKHSYEYRLVVYKGSTKASETFRDYALKGFNRHWEYREELHENIHALLDKLINAYSA
jgi:2-hydroxychromene-2-carboxylate isomerase